jgi:hypothetical protein
MELKEMFVSIPKTIDELSQVASHYNAIGLSGACERMDMVQIIKWSCCPTGNFNCAKGRKGYPTLGFQAIIRK